MTISANLVKELRERTGAGMMECKKALVETQGDIETALDLLRKKGQAKADNKASRVAAEGVIVALASPDQKTAVMIEVNCETDFVARDASFNKFVNEVAKLALTYKTKEVAELNEVIYENNHTVEQTRKELVAKVGENVQIRRIKFMNSPGVIGTYIHGGRIGVLVSMEQGTAELAKDLAMQVAASNPLVVNPEDVPAEKVAKEQEIYLAQAEANAGDKPKDILEKMVSGKVRKYLEEVSLVGQPFVKDPNKKIGQLLKETNAKVAEFVRFAAGEGIEKEVVNFRDEVMAQVKG